MENQATQRAEIHRTIWKIANDLRGAVDGWDFKQYVLDMLFYRYISEHLDNRISQEEGSDYASMADSEIDEEAKDGIVDDYGYFITPSHLFKNVLATARSNEDLNETLEQAFKGIEASTVGHDSNEDFQGLFQDLDLNSAKLGTTPGEKHDRLASIMEAVGSLNLGTTLDQASVDTFGDAYEYLMGMYASNAGKSGGEYFTPQCVSELLAQIAVPDSQETRSIYDPACGSGSLLLRAAKRADIRHVQIYGQEKNLTTYNLCRMNMMLHNVPWTNFHIAHGDTLLNPDFMEERPFDAIVSNPPYSTKWDGKTNPELVADDRFSPAGVLAPASKADLAFTMHMLSYLSDRGCAAIVEFPGVLYRGGAEKKIREYLLKMNYVDTVIQLPADLFFGTTIATCILVLRKNRAADQPVLFIDASQEFIRQDTKNVLTDENRARILNAMADRQPEEHFSNTVPVNDILTNDANLSVSSYVTKEDTREQIDIDELNSRIRGIVAHEAELRSKIDAIVADLEGMRGEDNE